MQALNPYFQSNLYTFKTIKRNEDELAKSKSVIQPVNTKAETDFYIFTTAKKTEKNLTFKGDFYGLVEVGGQASLRVFESRMRHALLELNKHGASGDLILSFSEYYKYCKEWAPTLNNGYRVSMAVDDSRNFYRKLKYNSLYGESSRSPQQLSQFDEMLRPFIYTDNREIYGANGILRLLKKAENELIKETVVGHEKFSNCCDYINSLTDEQLRNLGELGDFLSILREVDKKDGEFTHLLDPQTDKLAEQLEEEILEQKLLGSGYFSKEVEQAEQGQQGSSVQESMITVNDYLAIQQRKKDFSLALKLLKDEKYLSVYEEAMLKELIKRKDIKTLLQTEEHIKLVKQLKLLQEVDEQLFFTTSVDRPYVQEIPHDELHSKILDKGFEPYADKATLQVIGAPLGLFKFIQRVKDNMSRLPIEDQLKANKIIQNYFNPLKERIETYAMTHVVYAQQGLENFIKNDELTNKKSLAILEELEEIDRIGKPVIQEQPQLPDELIFEKVNRLRTADPRFNTTPVEYEPRTKSGKFSLKSISSHFRKKKEKSNPCQTDHNNADHDYQQFLKMMS